MKLRVSKKAWLAVAIIGLLVIGGFGIKTYWPNPDKTNDSRQVNTGSYPAVPIASLPAVEYMPSVNSGYLLEIEFDKGALNPFPRSLSRGTIKVLGAEREIVDVSGSVAIDIKTEGITQTRSLLVGAVAAGFNQLEFGQQTTPPPLSDIPVDDASKAVYVLNPSGNSFSVRTSKLLVPIANGVGTFYCQAAMTTLNQVTFIASAYEALPSTTTVHDPYSLLGINFLRAATTNSQNIYLMGNPEYSHNLAQIKTTRSFGFGQFADFSADKLPPQIQTELGYYYTVTAKQPLVAMPGKDEMIELQLTAQPLAGQLTPDSKQYVAVATVLSGYEGLAETVSGGRNAVASVTPRYPVNNYAAVVVDGAKPATITLKGTGQTNVLPYIDIVVSVYKADDALVESVRKGGATAYPSQAARVMQLHYQIPVGS